MAVQDFHRERTQDGQRHTALSSLLDALDLRPRGDPDRSRESLQIGVLGSVALKRLLASTRCDEVDDLPGLDNRIWTWVSYSNI
jgi:hypothetical protein